MTDKSHKAHKVTLEVKRLKFQIIFLSGGTNYSNNNDEQTLYFSACVLYCAQVQMVDESYKGQIVK